MALPIFFSDYVQAQVVAAANASQTTILISVPTRPLPDLSSEGAYTYLTFIDQPSFIINSATPVQREVMKLTAWEAVASGIQLTVVRAITTTAQIWAVGSIMELRACDQMLADLKDEGTAIQAAYLLEEPNAELVNSRTLVEGTNIDFDDTGPGGTLTINATGSMVQAEYLVLSLSSGLTSERVLTEGDNITFDDTGPNGTLTINAAGGGGTLQSEAFTADDDFIVPAGVTAVWVDAVGGGAGGGGQAIAGTNGRSGGGSGETIRGVLIPVTPLDVMAVVIGAGGTGGAATLNSVGAAGGNTTFGGLVAIGAPATGSAVGGGSGGGIGGGVGSAAAGDHSFIGLIGSLENIGYFGGGAGGTGATSVSSPYLGQSGAGSGGYNAGGAGGIGSVGGGGGGGGAATTYGIGGAGGARNAAGSDAPAGHFGAGGGGAGATAANIGGNGHSGYCLISWIG